MWHNKMTQDKCMETCFAFFFLIILEKLPVEWKKEGKEGRTDGQTDRWTDETGKERKEEERKVERAT